MTRGTDEPIDEVDAFRMPLLDHLRELRQARWKPKDSPQTMRTWGSDREFTSSTGERLQYESHVTLGHGVKPGASMQVYYRTLTDGRVEIAYAGTHLRTVSHDT